MVQDAYPTECELELEQPLATNIHMLECCIQVDGDHVVVSLRNRNGAALLTSFQQQYKKFVDFSSSHPFAVKLGVVIGAFTRVLRNTTEGASLLCLRQFVVYLLELSLLGYPTVFMQCVLNAQISCLIHDSKPEHHVHLCYRDCCNACDRCVCVRMDI